MQFERQGYSVRDADSTLDHQVFNRNDRLAQYVCEGSRRQELTSGPTYKSKPMRNAWPMSALERVTDSNQTSRDVDGPAS